MVERRRRLVNEDILTLHDVTKRYGRLVAVDEVSFSVPAGSIVALLGPNGAGKSTTFKCILGVTDFKGRVLVGGRSSRREGKEVRRLIGYLPQTPPFLGNDTCAQALSFLADLRGVEGSRIHELLEEVNLNDQWDVPTNQLSGGMRQRLALAAALLSDPPLLLLDEPTANLDVESRQAFHGLLMQLRKAGKTIILSTHFVEHMSGLADRVILLQSGRVALDSPVAKILANEGRRFHVHTNGTAPSALLEALGSIGIGAERVAPVEPNLEDALVRVLQDQDTTRAGHP
jgi:ABC-type multidrug transport system ATPase subunit